MGWLEFHAAAALDAEAVGTTAEGVGHYPKPDGHRFQFRSRSPHGKLCAEGSVCHPAGCAVRWERVHFFPVDKNVGHEKVGDLPKYME